MNISKLLLFLILIVVVCVLHFCSVESTIDIFDRYGRKVDSFADREATLEDEEFMPMEGYIVAADPQDACSPISSPTFLTNFTFGKFVLVNGTENCGFTQKVINAQEAGYDLVVIFDPYPIPFEHVFATKDNPEIEINIQVVLISFMNGITIRDNYLFNSSYEFNYRVRIRPNIPDITYYMYLFGAVIGVCFFVMLLFMLCLLVKCLQERRKHRRNRLSSRQIRQIPTAKFNKGDQYDVCAICLEDYKEGEKLRILPCSHAYHSKCIDPWLMNNRRNCPLCKRKITFGESEDESDSEDSELTSPAENTPLITPVHRTLSWGTFAANPVHANPDGSGPSSLPTNYQRVNQSFIPESDSASESNLAHSNQLVSLETENLLPPPQLSVNQAASGNSSNVVAVHVSRGRPNDASDLDGHHGLIV